MIKESQLSPQKTVVGKARHGRRLEWPQIGRSCCHSPGEAPVTCGVDIRGMSPSIHLTAADVLSKLKKDHVTPLLQALQKLSNTARI